MCIVGKLWISEASLSKLEKFQHSSALIDSVNHIHDTSECPHHTPLAKGLRLYIVAKWRLLPLIVFIKHLFMGTQIVLKFKLI